MQCYNKQGGLEDRKGEQRERRKRSKKRVIFLSSIPMGIAAGLFTRVATFHFLLCIFVCAWMCVCASCACASYVRVLLHRGDL